MPELEDTHADVLRKAMVGLKIPADLAAERAGIDPARVRSLLNEYSDREALEKLAPVLGLSSKGLIDLAENRWYPEVTIPHGLIQVSTEFRGGEVNAFVLYDSERNAVVFDTGTDPQPLFDAVEGHALQVQAIFITHGHRDHISCLPDLSARWAVPVYAVDSQRVLGATALCYGNRYQVGALNLRILKTVGHAADGASVVVEGLSQPLVVVGDALFAGSMGGGMVSFSQAYESSLSQLMSLDPETLVCPGHGPLTTIGQEQEHNAFFGE
ncbi:MAG: MBL fold metallo-hydrolase [Verrucomicrobiota bacterium]